MRHARLPGCDAVGRLLIAGSLIGGLALGARAGTAPAAAPSVPPAARASADAQALSLLRQAASETASGQFPEAVRDDDAAAALAQHDGLTDRQGAALVGCGYAFYQWGRYDEATARFRAALALATAHASPCIEAAARNGLGTVLQNTARYPEALSEFERVREIATRLNNAGDQAAAIGNIGIVYERTSRYRDAMTAYQESLALLRGYGKESDPAARGTLRNIAALHQNIGNVYLKTGRFAQALAQYEESLRLWRDVLKDVKETAKEMDAIGGVSFDSGDMEASLTQRRAALDLIRDIDYPEGKAGILNNLGDTYQALGRYAEALAAYEESRTYAARMDDRDGIAQTIHNEGDVYRKMGEFERAMARYRASIAAKQENDDPVGIPFTQLSIGDLRREKGYLPEARAAYRAALSIAEQRSDPVIAFKARASLGDVERVQKRWDAAAREYRRAIALVEQVRAQAEERTLQASFFSQYTGPYVHLVEVLLAQGAPVHAFEASEQAKGRALVDVLGASSENTAAPMTPDERTRDADLRARISQFTADLDHARGTDARRLESDRERALTDYGAFRRALYLRHPDRPTPFSAASLDRLDRALFAGNPGLCLLSYTMSDDETLLFCIRRPAGGGRARLTVHRIPVRREDLDRRIESFRAMCSNARSRFRSLRAQVVSAPGDDVPEAREASARALYDLLLAPAARELRGTSHVVILPDGALHTLPFQALLDRSGQPLIAACAVSYAPSATALVAMYERGERRRAEWAGRHGSLLAVGHPAYGEDLPELPETQAEVESIAAEWGGTPLTGADATRARVMAAMPEARYIHLATHGLVNGKFPLFSAVALASDGSDDGYLYAQDLLGMHLTAEMAVLSACDTALGQEARGEGILGLSWALFVAGVPTSVVTQWSVADDSTRLLMVAFYRQLKAGRDKAEALRQAQLSLMRDGRHAHPFHWAPFVLIGAW